MKIMVSGRRKIRMKRFNQAHQLLKGLGFDHKRTQGDALSASQGDPTSDRYTLGHHVNDELEGAIKLFLNQLHRSGFGTIFKLTRNGKHPETVIIIDHPGDKPMPRLKW